MIQGQPHSPHTDWLQDRRQLVWGRVGSRESAGSQPWPVMEHGSPAAPLMAGNAGDTSDSLDARPDLHPPLDVPVPGAEAQLLLLAADGTPTHTAFMVVQTLRQLPVTRHQIQDTRTLEGPELLGFCCRKRLPSLLLGFSQSFQFWFPAQ